VSHTKPPLNKAVKHILHKRRLAPKKRFGQNFLVHPHTAERIVKLAGIKPTDIVLEIGSGLGALTRPLAAQADKVISLEIDAGIVRWLKEEGRLPTNTALIHQDIMKADFHQLADLCGGRLKIIANLPYSISNPLLFKLIENQAVIDWAVFMLQKEVGQRLTAAPGGKDYGILSVLLGACAEVTPLLDIGPGNFHPRPKVDSLVIRVVFYPPSERIKALPAYDRKILHGLVKAAFQQRRKTLLNALVAAKLLNGDKKNIEQTLGLSGISPDIRGEKLSLEEFVKLAAALEKVQTARQR